MGARGRRTGRPGRKRTAAAWAWAPRRRSKAVLEWAASSLWEPFVKRFEVCDDSDS